MKEIVVISGKGGTGKTSIAASFASLANGKAVLADCDVDAADLHLVLNPSILKQTEFRSGHKAVIRDAACKQCGRCMELCRFGAVKSIEINNDKKYIIDPVRCDGCGVCSHFCPEKAIDFNEEICGNWFISDTRFGKMVHAKLGIAADNSGKLVTLVRTEAKKIADKTEAEYIIIDGSPGIGCPVIASLTAADNALIVTEPTVSGNHDFLRIASLTKKLGIKTIVCVNKWDINPDFTEQIKAFTETNNMTFAGLVRYDKSVSAAQRLQKTVTEFSSGGAAEDIRQIWNFITKG
jgi:MinD superfamily P-loop ATPase